MKTTTTTACPPCPPASSSRTRTGRPARRPTRALPSSARRMQQARRGGRRIDAVRQADGQCRPAVRQPARRQPERAGGEHAAGGDGRDRRGPWRPVHVEHVVASRRFQCGSPPTTARRSCADLDCHYRRFSSTTWLAPSGRRDGHAQQMEPGDAGLHNARPRDQSGIPTWPSIVIIKAPHHRSGSWASIAS